MNRRNALVAAATVAILALVGWLSIRQADDGSVTNTTGAMAGMTTAEPKMATTTATENGNGMPGMSMGHSATSSPMKPLAAGANGTHDSAAGLTLKPKHAVIPAGQPTQWQLQIVDRKEMPVTTFQRDQTKLLHLIVVRTDLTDYQHLHPILGRGGIFSIRLRIIRPGAYRAIADFTTAGRRYALGVPIHVPGAGTQMPLPPESTRATTDGFSVDAIHESPKAGHETSLEFVIRRAGRPVTELMTYLGAYGHLVALRKTDIAYSHVHPLSEDLNRGLIRFSAEFPTSGAYRLFLQFRTTSGVHTAAFTINVPT